MVGDCDQPGYSFTVDARKSYSSTTPLQSCELSVLNATCVNGEKLYIGSEMEVVLEDKWGGCSDDGHCHWSVGEDEETYWRPASNRISSRTGFGP